MKIETGKPKKVGHYWVSFDDTPYFWDGERWWFGNDYWPSNTSDRFIYIGKKPSFKKVKGK